MKWIARCSGSPGRTRSRWRRAPAAGGGRRAAAHRGPHPHGQDAQPPFRASAQGSRRLMTWPAAPPAGPGAFLRLIGCGYVGHNMKRVPSDAEGPSLSRLGGRSVKRTGSDESLRCSFCHKSQDVVGKLISSPSDYPRAYICDECIAVCNSILEDDRSEQPQTAAHQASQALGTEGISGSVRDRPGGARRRSWRWPSTTTTSGSR